MPFVPVNGCTLYFEAGGAGSPVVYVHGGFASLDTILRKLRPFDWGWENDFAAQFHFVVYDRRGCYRSSSPATGYDLLTQVQDLTGLLDHLSISAVHIIGSSAGGPIATIFAATQPQRVRSLILTGAALELFPREDPRDDKVRELLVILEREGAEVAFDRRPVEVEVTFSELWDLPEAIARGTLNEYLARQQQWRVQAQQLPRAQRVHHYATELRNIQAYMTTDVRSYAPAVTCPTYIIHGEKDQIVPLAWAEELARAIPSAYLDVMPDGSHTLMPRNAEARRRVMAFMRQADMLSST